MSTNDTLRGLLAEAREDVSRMLTYTQQKRKERIALLDRIDAALAEPVSGGVLLPERKPANFHWNEFLEEVKRLNGGAVAGQEIPFAGFDPNFCPGSNPDNLQGPEDLTSEELDVLFSPGNGNKAFRRAKSAMAEAAQKSSPICDCRQGRDACTCKGGE